jgi:hypothetical protein
MCGRRAEGVLYRSLRQKKRVKNQETRIKKKQKMHDCMNGCFDRKPRTAERERQNKERRKQ